HEENRTTKAALRNASFLNTRSTRTVVPMEITMLSPPQSSRLYPRRLCFPAPASAPSRSLLTHHRTSSAQGRSPPLPDEFRASADRTMQLADKRPERDRIFPESRIPAPEPVAVEQKLGSGA